MDILLACECSGEVRDAMAARGHNAISCDILPTEKPGQHIQKPLEDVLYSRRWDMILAFPPCTYLCSSGLHWNTRRPERAQLTEEALAFVVMILNAEVDKLALENSIGCISTRIARNPKSGIYYIMDKPDPKKGITPQIIQPHQFGEDASKATCLFLKGLPPLQGTRNFPPRIVNGKKRWGNQTDSGQNRLGPSDERAGLRAKTYPGIAKAMAEQWG